METSALDMSANTETESLASSDLPPNPILPKRIATEISAVHGTGRNEFWRKRNLLSLDGGGIRGYWTLLVLKYLMELIYYEEKKQAQVAQPKQTRFDSFYPQQFPHNVSQLVDETGNDPDHPSSSLSRRFLPCHYFDFICGSSTGGLIAIMLGSFRMTVDDCISEYKEMGHRIFGKPRWLSQRNTGMPWAKFSARSMGKAFKEVSLRRCDGSQQGRHHSTIPTFPTTEGICQTFVTSIRRTKNPSGPWVDGVYIIRSYNNDNKHRQGCSSDTQSENASEVYMTVLPEVNHGPAETMEIWQVARAATAAPMFFKELRFSRLHGAKGQKYYFSDGGFGETNNPTDIGFREIDELPGSHTIGAIVNIGTARGKADPSHKSVLNIMKRMAGKATDPNIVANSMAQRKLKNYFRFNDNNGIDVELDEWKPSGWYHTSSSSGATTLKTIEDAFNAWIRDHDNKKWLKKCAKELVRIRRGRCVEEEASRWEQFALGAHSYRCKHEDCCNEPPCSSRHQFMQHWVHFHEGEEDGDLYMEPTFRQWEYQRRPENRR